MNSIPYELHWQLDALWSWFDDEPSLRVAIITGAGTKSFCAGSDLIEIDKVNTAKQSGQADAEPWKHSHPKSGFAGLSRRDGRKPIIAAVNGFALGGGMEIVLNCDMVIASPTASFGLPEAQRGLYASGGGLPRLLRTVGLPVASDMALTGRLFSVEEARECHLINRIAASAESLLSEAVEIADSIAAISPGAIVVTRAALREAWETASVERAFQLTHERYDSKLMKGFNAKEGLAAFKEKRSPRWQGSKL
ncbi:ClpP/crotonase-like domain-containing protein [Exophiala viscosa]|uniref:ClpP/crotonase-like domain-containing protein n=1 Tax=Exophiala viscosa TaxID=2486360 RepID=A0AAN6IDQ2_9EURO|nr:ClpP/crotonase-like domain-containing protein [Exophiala viscosa]KAI1622318.1 ClpP/crotonase-like domain-containing protein [Exophiala viscosa]